MKNKPKPISRSKKKTKSALKKTAAVKAALLGKKKKSARKTGKNKIETLDKANLHKMNKELRETKECLRLFSEAAEEGIAVHDKGVIIDANDALTRIFGYELSEMIGMKAEKFATPESWKVIWKHIATEYDKPYEGVGVRKDGSTFICSLVGKPYKYKGRTLRLTTFRDITERKHAEDELRLEEKRFRALAEQSSDIIVFVNREGIVNYENPAVEKSLGLKAEERIGANVFDRIHPDDLKFATDVFNAFTLNMFSKDINSPVRQIRLRHQDGSWRTFETSGTKLLKDDIIDAVIINLRDITERKMAEDAMRRSEEEYRSLFEQSLDGIIIIYQSRIVMANHAFCVISGLPLEKAIGANPLDFIHPEDRKMAEQRMRAIKSGEQFSETYVYRTLRADGSLSWIDLRSKLFPWKGKPAFQTIVRDITELKKAEETSKKAASEWQSTFDTVGDAICLLDIDQRILRCNLAMSGMFGVKQEKLIGRHCWEVVHGTTKPIPGCPASRTKSSLVREEMELQLKDRWFNVIADPILDETGAIQGVIHIVRDITERKDIDDKLRYEAQRFRTLAEQSSDIIVLVNREGTIMYENLAVEKILGFKREERIGVNVFDRIHPDDLKLATDAFNSLPRDKNVPAPHFEIRLRHNDGSWRTFEIVGNKLHDDNIVEIAIINLRDISERKRMEDELRREEQLFRAFAEQSSDIIVLMNLDGVITYINPVVERALGFKPEERIGARGFERIHPDDLKSLNDKFNILAKDTASPVLKSEMRLRHKDGSWRIFEAVGTNLVNNNVVESIIVNYRDITERRKTENELKKYREHLEYLVQERTIKLEAANKELESFSYSASHDLRAPLRTIEGFSQALLEDCEDKLDLHGRDYLKRIITATRHMALLIEDMLKLSRITRTEMNIDKVNLTQIARSIINELKESQPQRHVEIKIADGLEDEADSRLMRILLENLLDNAWKFTGNQANAVIEFGFTKKGEKKIYFVRDNGAGFDMMYVDKLFAPFQRLHSFDEYPGTGIGLATVQRIINRHGGKAWTEGQVGKGATFYFTLKEH